MVIIRELRVDNVTKPIREEGSDGMGRESASSEWWVSSGFHLLWSRNFPQQREFSRCCGVWHLRLHFGKLSPLYIVHEACSCDTETRSFTKMYTLMYARGFVQCYRAHYVIEVLILWSWQMLFLCLCIHNVYTDYIYEHTALYSTYTLPHCKPLHQLCSWSGYGPELNWTELLLEAQVKLCFAFNETLRYDVISESGGRPMDLRVLSFGTGWRWVVSFMPRPSSFLAIVE